MRGLCSANAPWTTLDRAGGHVVVVPAGVVLLGPAQQPHVHVLVAVERDVVPLLAGERDVLSPRLGFVRRGRSRVRAAPPGRGCARATVPGVIGELLPARRRASRRRGLCIRIADRGGERADRGRSGRRRAGRCRAPSRRCPAPGRSRRPRGAVGGGVQEHVADRRRPGRRRARVAFAVQRRETGQHGEAHPQVGVRRSAARESRPGGVHLLHVGHQRGPPAGHVVGVGPAGPGCTNSGRPRWASTSSRGRRPSPAGSASASAGSCRPTAAAREFLVQRGRVRFGQAGRGPGSRTVRAARARRRGRRRAAAGPARAAATRCPAGWTARPARVQTVGAASSPRAAPRRGRPGSPRTAARRPGTGSCRPGRAGRCGAQRVEEGVRPQVLVDVHTHDLPL